MVVGLFFGDPFLNVSLFQYLFVVMKLQALDNSSSTLPAMLFAEIVPQFHFYLILWCVNIQDVFVDSLPQKLTVRSG